MQKYVLLLALFFFSQASFAAQQHVAGNFDYYVLALSWSPQHCARNPKDTQQCYRQLGFVLHGLWPQYNKGYPSHCHNEKMPKKLIHEFAGLYPNNRLFSHEWKKHGTCSGLSPKRYLKKSKKLKERVMIPPTYQQPQNTFKATLADLKAAFIAQNPKMTEDHISVFCSRNQRFLREVRICFNKDGNKFQACSKKMLKTSQRQCGQKPFIVRHVR